MAVQLRGRRSFAEGVDRVKRPDVRRQFGLTHDEYGFRARFRIAELTNAGPADLAGLRVLAGARPGHADTPLRLGGTVRDLLKAANGAHPDTPWQDRCDP